MDGEERHIVRDFGLPADSDRQRGWHEATDKIRFGGEIRRGRRTYGRSTRITADEVKFSMLTGRAGSIIGDLLLATDHEEGKRQYCYEVE